MYHNYFSKYDFAILFFKAHLIYFQNAFEFAHRENYDVILSCDYLNHSYNSGSQNYPKLKILSQTEQ